MHLAVDTLGHLLALHVTPANEQERAQVAELAEQVQETTGDTVEVAFVDQGYTGEAPAQAAAHHGIELIVVKLPEAKKGFVLLPKRWVVMPAKGIDSIVECDLARDFDLSASDALTSSIEKATVAFIDDIERYLSEHQPCC